MANVIIRPDWVLPEKLVTPEEVYRNRRTFLRTMGVAGAGLIGGSAMGAAKDVAKYYPAKKNPALSSKLAAGDRMTKEEWATGYNNFYEFTTRKEWVKHPHFMGKFVVDPWKVRIDGLCNKPFDGDAYDLIGEMGKQGKLEDRTYRFRCVEAWSMIVPWTGFQLSELIKLVEPKAEAKFVRMTTAVDFKTMPGAAQMKNYTWPYQEGLRMDEAMHPLTIMATGMYGKPLPKQNGAPLRLIVPWKYGYKSIKSIVRIELVAKQPKTFWEIANPKEYPFESNVDPAVPHPRWSQATEQVLGLGHRINTLKYNGFGKEVAALYK
ncbi:MAG: protein-methionine-sulfoxide reductase catalytic subunit MsrP [Verrucomicrobiales bacterium]|nr:protein-methionine-sulfoxide reductase catalytic subunit MsrP [Verrucomicrobiales bacterium]|tara:strand:+ start:682 stop:1644 length:963 start_codon:yes stop_codon:yes gene_type:complete